MLTRACAAMRTAAGKAGSALPARAEHVSWVTLSAAGSTQSACAIQGESQWVLLIGSTALQEPSWRLQHGLRLVDACGRVLGWRASGDADEDSFGWRPPVTRVTAVVLSSAQSSARWPAKQAWRDHPRLLRASASSVGLKERQRRGLLAGYASGGPFKGCRLRIARGLCMLALARGWRLCPIATSRRHRARASRHSSTKGGAATTDGRQKVDCSVKSCQVTAEIFDTTRRLDGVRLWASAQGGFSSRQNADGPPAAESRRSRTDRTPLGWGETRRRPLEACHSDASLGQTPSRGGCGLPSRGSPPAAPLATTTALPL